jgi:thiol-disulfide isomerase/thioredoxin
MKLFYCLLIILWPFISTGQTYKTLHTGDKMPDITLAPILNYPASKANFSDFKNKLVLFDFMTTGCASCIAALPRFDSLQKAYSGQLQIILVIPESVARVQSFLKRKNIVNLHLTAIAGDTILSQLFPHTYISHDVLVKNGKVISITYPEYIISKNLETILEGKNISLPVKRDITAFQYKEPLLHLNENIIPDFSYPAAIGYSAVSSYLDNVPWRYTLIRDTSNHTLRISFINVPVPDLYIHTLYGDQLRPAFILLDVSDTTRFAYNMGSELSQEWIRKNTYCYEGSFPLDYPASLIKRKISNDLDFYFQLYGRMEKKDLLCWVIRRDSSIQSESLTNKASENIQGKSIESVVFDLNGSYGTKPVIDESGCGEIKLSGLSTEEYKNIPMLRKKLQEYGLKITAENRTIDMLVITQNNQHNFLINQK